MNDHHLSPQRANYAKAFTDITGGNKVSVFAKRRHNTLRIIAGNWRGRQLTVATIKGLRPTTDRVRETVFNWLAAYLPGARCLDLFAGTGALGMEALSRNAIMVDIVELSQVAYRQLRNNLANLPLSGEQRAYVHHMSYCTWLRQVQRPYDIVFLDPPFALSLMEELLERFAASDWLACNGLIYVEHPRPLDELTLPKNWCWHRQKRTGQVHYGLIKVQ